MANLFLKGKGKMQLIYQYFRLVHHAKKKSGFSLGREESFLKVF